MIKKWQHARKLRLTQVRNLTDKRWIRYCLSQIKCCCQFLLISMLIKPLFDVHALPFQLETTLYGGKVWIDGQLVGHTPLSQLELREGLHVLDLRWGGGRIQKLFWVSATQTSFKLQISTGDLQSSKPLILSVSEDQEREAEHPTLTELMFALEVTTNEQLGVGSSQIWSIKHPMIPKKLHLVMEGMNLSILRAENAKQVGSEFVYGGMITPQKYTLYTRQFGFEYVGHNLQIGFGRAPLTLQPRLTSVPSFMGAPHYLSRGKGSSVYHYLYADQARIAALWDAWTLSAQVGRLSDWSSKTLRTFTDQNHLPYAAQLRLNWVEADYLNLSGSLYALSRLSEDRMSDLAYDIERWGAMVNFEIKGPPETINHLQLGVASAERSLLALIANGAGELLGVMVRGNAELLRSHPLYQVRAPWSLWPDAFEGDRARLSLSTEHIRWIEVKLESQGGGIPTWLNERLLNVGNDYSGFFITRYMSYPLMWFGAAYTKLSATNRWRISLGGGELETSFRTALWAGSPEAVNITDPLTAQLGISWRSMDLGLLSMRIERGPIGAWGATVELRLVFDVIGIGISCDRPTVIGLIPVKNLLSCGIDLSLLKDVQFIDP